MYVPVQGKSMVRNPHLAEMEAGNFGIGPLEQLALGPAAI